MREAAETWRYAAALSVLVVAEWLYIDWASRAPLPLLDNFVHAEWRRRRSLQALENVHVRSVCVGRSEEGEFEGDSPKEEVAAQIRLAPHSTAANSEGRRRPFRQPCPSKRTDWPLVSTAGLCQFRTWRLSAQFVRSRPAPPARSGPAATAAPAPRAIRRS
jgi:hypothetical protein